MHAPPKILGLGSFHGDDQAAWRLIELLSSDPKCADRCARLCSPWDILSHLADGGPLVIVDACISGAAAGTIRRWTAQELPSDSGIRMSSHGGGLGETFALAGSLGYDLSKASVIGIEVEATAPGTPLSPAVQRAVAELARLLSDEITQPEVSTESAAP
jgi:hydrogenase maturation protease